MEVVPKDLVVCTSGGVRRCDYPQHVVTRDVTVHTSCITIAKYECSHSYVERLSIYRLFEYVKQLNYQGGVTLV